MDHGNCAYNLCNGAGMSAEIRNIVVFKQPTRRVFRPFGTQDLAAKWVGWLREVVEDVCRVSTVLCHPLRHAYLARLLSRPAMRDFSTNKIKLQFKYLVDYASMNLSTHERYQVLCAHYLFLQEHFRPDFLRAICSDSIQVWHHSNANSPLTIDLNFPESMQTEGDLCLTLHTGERKIYRLIFSIAVGATFGLGAPYIILITCVQGLQSTADIRDVAASCQDIHPADLLMAALAGVAGAIGIDTLMGITTDNQIANKGRIFFSYDDFFGRYGEYWDRINAYQITLPYPQKSLTEIAAKHRGRTRAKRKCRWQLTEKCRFSVTDYLINRPPGLMAAPEVIPPQKERV